MWPNKPKDSVEELEKILEWTIDSKTNMFTFNVYGAKIVMPTSSILGVLTTSTGGLEVLAAHEELSLCISSNYKHIALLRAELIKAMEKEHVAV